MATLLLKKTLISTLRPTQSSTGILCNSIRNHWNYQYKPGPYPKTLEEREAAAKKYKMSIEEYRPYPEDMGYGDYPKLPDIGADSKDPFYPYDFPESKRNFNEPIHARAEIFGGDRYDISMKPRYSVAYQLCCFLTAIGTFGAIYYYLEDYKIGRPVLAKQYPTEGPHYYFCTK